MNKTRPLGVTLIGGFYILGAVVLILSLFFFDSSAGEFGIAARFGLPMVPESVMRVLVAAVSLVMAYGYLKLQKWGYWLMMVYSLYFGAVSVLLSMQYHQQPFYGNALWSVIVLIYTFMKRDDFLRD